MSKAMETKWTIVLRKAPRGLAKVGQEGTRQGLTAAGRQWHKEFLPIHFTMEAYRRYGYKDRGRAVSLSKVRGITVKTKSGKEQYVRTKVDKRGRPYIVYFNGQKMVVEYANDPGGLGWGVAIDYNREKLRKFGHMNPLVYTGVLKRYVTAGARMNATTKRVEVRMSGPKWLRGKMMFRGRRNTGPDMVKEMTTIPRIEALALAKTVKDRMVKSIKDYKQEEKMRIANSWWGGF